MVKHIFGLLLFTAFTLYASEFPVCTSSGNQFFPVVASCGMNYFVAWSDEINYGSTGSDIWGRIVFENEIMKDSFPICNSSGNQVNPKIAFDGDNYLVIWISDNGGLYGQFIDTSGALADTNFLITGGAIDFPAIATNSSNYLITWTDSGLDINACILSKAGAQIAAPFPVCTAADTQIHPSAAPIPSGYVVVWADKRAGNFDTYGQRISSTGTLINYNFSISPTSVPQQRPNVASSGSHTLVAWEEDHGMIVGFDVHASILDTAMAYLYNDFAVCNAQLDQRGPSVCWDYKINEFLAGWHDYRVPIINRANIYMSRVDQSANTAEIQITNNDSYEHRETNIARSINCYIIVWEDWRQGTSNKNIYAYIPTHSAVEDSSNSTPQFLIPNPRAFPNPFINSTLINYNLPFTNCDLRISLYDISGKLIETTDNPIIGKNLKAGIYFVRVGKSKPVKITKIK